MVATFLKTEKTEKIETRYRTFDLKPIERANLFEGLPFIAFDVFVRRGTNK